eukprot:CAMPEP_0175044042 /NCGR_PEP_ID=MMETSP0052_2-20121109/3564_1 /TAXON_ID=51329 ORGANISM="Polytomella parva, Strain SAG 63-3" /NCGR_SAMPLE_ID=MMETSP0052_2 /ASSEMBLY_ACC=CAM_ASM_000194 /LENGTH=194 /DNA_ID=CAMNT_0016307251 /DNA_START=2258 /DNA_END=2842 /DNA_ORIENTATION=-
MDFFEAPVASIPPTFQQEADNIFFMASAGTPEAAPQELFFGASAGEGVISDVTEPPLIAPPPIYTPLPFEPISSSSISTPTKAETTDPRIEWRRLNTEKLKKQDAEEVEAKAKQQSKAKDYLKKFLEERSAKIASTKEVHAKSDAKKIEEAKFENTWDKVIDMTKTPGTINRTKDVGKLKSVLLSAKAKNVLVL